MSESEIQAVEHEDNWVFDSLVNFLHGSIWKVPVVGFIEEKSVVFDPDSFNNMTEEKEEEFRKIHEEYKSVVDYMLASFMEDLQVTPEQVEVACRVREHQSKALPESHITKVALEQLWAAEDFTAFRRLMTRKNIDLQLQSLELLVAKYGVLSPALRSGESEEAAGEDGEDDFLQVVIRYSDQLELFKCDYGTEERSRHKGEASDSNNVRRDEDDSKNMKLHLAGIPFKNNQAPKPANFQTTLTSSSSSSTPTVTAPIAVTPPASDSPTLDRNNLEISENLSKCDDIPSHNPSHPKSTTASPIKSTNDIAPEEMKVEESLTVADNDNPNSGIQSEAESQLIQLEEAEEALGGESVEKVKERVEEAASVHSDPAKEKKLAKAPSVRFDEQTAVEIASTATEQRRLLTAVRKALEINPDGSEASTASIDIPAGEQSEDLQKRREYLRAQRDKLIAMKKQEREKLLADTSNDTQRAARPKSARAAKMALTTPNSMRAASISEKSLSARRALADRLKQELIEK